jgi:dipeptide/tripeptide permease
MVAGCAIAAAGVLMLAVLPGPWAYLGALAVAGAGSGLLDVAPSAMLGDLLSAQPRQDGILVAFFQMAGDAGTVTGPVIAGLLVDSASYPAAFALAGGVLAAAALLAAISRPRQTQSTSAKSSCGPPSSRDVAAP